MYQKILAPLLNPKKSLLCQYLYMVLFYVLWALAYPPGPLGPMMVVVFAGMWWVSDQLSTKHAFWAHFVGGVFFNILTYYWVYNVIQVGPVFIILLGLALMVVFFSLLNGYLGWLYLKHKNIPGLFWIYPVAWVGFEVIRTWGQMSFPWTHVGYTWGKHLASIQIVSLVGIFGLSLFILYMNVLFYKWIQSKKILYLVLFVSALLANWAFGMGRISKYSHLFTSPQSTHTIQKEGLSPKVSSEYLDIALVQPSIPQTKKWDEEYFAQVMRQTFDLVDTSHLNGIELLVFAETAVPAFLQTQPNLHQHLQKISSTWNTHLLIGSLDLEESPLDPRIPYLFYNSAFLYSPDTNQLVLKYDKVNLVPFSEKLPFGNFFPILNFVDLGQANFSPGKNALVWKLPQAISPSICYEVVYPSFYREARRLGAKVLVNITNDGWFGRSSAPYQHANISKYRALEVGLPMARCANSGISLFVNPLGQVTASTQLLEKTILRQKVSLHSLNTMYMKWGDFIEKGLGYTWILIQVLLVIIWLVKLPLLKKWIKI